MRRRAHRYSYRFKPDRCRLDAAARRAGDGRLAPVVSRFCNIGSDMGKMLPMNDALAGQYGTRPRQHLADGGFAKLDDIEALAQNGVETFVPVPKPRNADRDRLRTGNQLRRAGPSISRW
jgi:hypothetical protein